MKLYTGEDFVVDQEDLEAVSVYTWYRRKCVRSCYAQTTIDGKMVTMHRFLLGLSRGDGLTVDHINGDGLDNRRANLRLCTTSQNGANRRRNLNNTSGVRGVHLCNGRWRVRLMVQGKRLHFKTYLTLEEAKAAMEAAWLEHYGEFAP